MINFNKNQSGAAMLFFVIFFTIASSALLFSLSRSLYGDLYIISSLQSSKQAYITAESALEDRVFKMMDTGSFPQTSTTFSAMLGEANVKVNYNSTSDTYTVISTSTVGRTSKVSVVELSPGAGTAFNYGVQSGNGGISLSVNSSIRGNVFSNGSVVGTNKSLIRGDVISASTTGKVDNVHATGSVWTNILKSSRVDKNAYFNVSEGINNIAGTTNTPFSPFPATSSLPISDAEIQGWKDNISNSVGCAGTDYTISSNVSVGNLKIDCNLIINSAAITITGPIWVTGNISFAKKVEINLASNPSSRSVQFIADGSINFSNQVDITSSDPAAYVMFLSQNNSAETGGSAVAIDVSNKTSGKIVLYAGHGLIRLSNNSDFKSLTAYQINIEGSSEITYESGLANMLFTGGPGGGYEISDWYQE